MGDFCVLPQHHKALYREVHPLNIVPVHIGISQIRGTFLGVPILRIIIFWGLYWGPLVSGNYHIGVNASKRGWGLIFGGILSCLESTKLGGVGDDTNNTTKPQTLKPLNPKPLARKLLNPIPFRPLNPKPLAPKSLNPIDPQTLKPYQS